MKRVLTAATLIGVGIFAACSKDDEPPPEQLPPLPLDERLGPGQTRAGLITKESELIGGETARGRIGDFKIYNSKVRMIVSAPGQSRGYHPYGGTILDADLVREPGVPGQSTFGEVIVGMFQYALDAQAVEVVSDGRNGGEARVRVRGNANNFPLFDAFIGELLVDHMKPDIDFDVDYVLEPDAQHVRIEYSVKSRSHTNTTADIGVPIAGFLFGDGADPMIPGHGFRLPRAGGVAEYYAASGDTISYVYGNPISPLEVMVAESGVLVTALGEGVTLRALEQKGFAHVLVIGDGDFAKTQGEWRRIQGKPANGVISGRVIDAMGAPVAGARVHVTFKEPIAEEIDYVTRSRTDADGRFSIGLVPDRYLVQVAADGHTIPSAVEVSLSEAAPTSTIEVRLDRPGRVQYSINDSSGRALPAKISMVPAGRSIQTLPARFGERLRPSGVEHTELAYRGEGSFELPAGEYRVIVSRGVEYEIDERTVMVTPDSTIELMATLARTVDTTGWMSTDTHIHAQLSPDSPDLYPFKVKAMVVENLELPISTEHESIGDFTPAIEALGVSAWMKGIIGSEITTMVYGHFNAWPLVRDPTRPGNGRIEWYYQPPAVTFSRIRTNGMDPYLQVNHPRSQAIGGYLSAMGFDPETFTSRRPDDFSLDFDGLEVKNGCGGGDDVMRDWFSLLNHGKKRFATGSTDNHKAGTGEMGLPLTFVKMSTDDPAKADVEEMRVAMKAGRMFVTCGPFLGLSMGAAQMGDTVRVSGDLVSVEAKVSAPSWMDIDTLDLVVNGQTVKSVEIPDVRAPVRFMGTVTASVTAGQDGWLIVRARGGQRHGIHARHQAPYAFTNPIFLDGNGDGAWTISGR